MAQAHTGRAQHAYAWLWEGDVLTLCVSHCLCLSGWPVDVQEIKNVLEAEIVEILNQGAAKQLLKLHGIGKKRADLILQVRREGTRAAA